MKDAEREARPVGCAPEGEQLWLFTPPADAPEEGLPEAAGAAGVYGCS